MKLVINKCFGGFGLSPIAIEEYLKLKGKKAFFYVQDYDLKGKPYIRKTTKELKTEQGMLFSYIVLTIDLGERLLTFPDDTYFSMYGIERNDKDLVAVVEKLGSKKASSSLAKLEVVEIPDGIEYEIDEYDGIEYIHEKHRSW